MGFEFLASVASPKLLKLEPLPKNPVSHSLEQSIGGGGGGSEGGGDGAGTQ